MVGLGVGGREFVQEREVAQEMAKCHDANRLEVGVEGQA